MTLVLYHDPDPNLMERHLVALKRRYNLISLRTFVNALAEGATSALPDRCLVVTLDDGHRGNLGLVPRLERLQVPVTIFLCASIVGTRRQFWFNHVPDPIALKRMPDSGRLEVLERVGFQEYGPEAEALSDEEIRAMSGPWVDFQSHGLTHAILPGCPPEKARSEVVDARQALEARYGLDIFAFSYPNGDYGEREVSLVRDGGYMCGVTVDEGINGPSADRFRLKRICIDDGDDLDALVVKASGVWGLLRRPSIWQRRGSANH